MSIWSPWINHNHHKVFYLEYRPCGLSAWQAAGRDTQLSLVVPVWSNWVALWFVCIRLACTIKPQQDIASPQWNPYEVRGRDGRGGEGGGLWKEWVKRRKKEEEGGFTLSPHAASPTWLLFLSERRERDRANKHWPPVSPPLISFTSLHPHGLRFAQGWGWGGGVHTDVNTCAHMVSLLRCVFTCMCCHKREKNVFLRGICSAGGAWGTLVHLYSPSLLLHTLRSLSESTHPAQICPYTPLLH